MPSRGADAVTWLGHATVLIELGGRTVLTDPVLRSRVAHLQRHAPAPTVPPELDAILVSHAHRDHLDTPSLRRLAPAVPVIAPSSAVGALRGAGHPTVHEVAAGDTLALGGEVSVQVVPAVHDGRRHPLAALGASVGFVIQAARRRVYFAGDTERFEAMTEPAPLDVALLPVSGWGPTTGPGHMDPLEAARTAALLRPALAIPIHWGTLLQVGLARRRPDLLTEPGRAFAGHVARLAPGVEVAVIAPGDRRVL